VRLLICRCRIDYRGRLTTRLGPGERVVLFKDDGSVCVHSVRGARPVNYMPGPTAIREEDGIIRVIRPASDEELCITVEEVVDDRCLDLLDAAPLERQGSERDLHACLVARPEVIEEGLVVVEQERPTDVGPVDLWCRDWQGRTTLVEVKRIRATAAAVEQVVRYREQAERNRVLRPVRALVVAPDFAPQAQVLADARDVERVSLDVEGLLAQAEHALTLFG
jgi:RecB family endonuclease NucS